MAGITQRANGTWKVQWFEGKKRPSRTFPTEDEARAFLAEIEAGEAIEGDDGSGGNEYSVNELSGEYRFSIVGRPSVLVLPGEQVDRLVADYVKDGGNFTQAELARAHGLVRRDVNAVLKALHVFKNSPPFTPEAMADKPEESLVDEWLAAKVHRVEKKSQARMWAEMERDAMRWRTFDRSVTSRMSDLLSESVTMAWPTWRPPVFDTQKRRALIPVITDLHVGKLSWDGFGPGSLTTEEHLARLDVAIARMLDEVVGTPERVILPIGGDFFNVDNSGGATTRGTPQDNAMTPEEMVRVGTLLCFNLVHRFASIAPVELVLHGGNHDAMLSVALFAGLEAAFKDTAHVTHGGIQAHKYGPYTASRFGSSLVGFTHGDGRYKPADLGPLMAQRWPTEYTETEHRLWILGHRHHFGLDESHGVQVWTMPSLSGSDRYHARHWPHDTMPRLGTHVLDYDRGPVSIILTDGE